MLKQVQHDGYFGFQTEFVTLNLFQGPFLVTRGAMKRERDPCVYILASGHYGTLYIGVTSNLLQRLVQHRKSLLPGFTSKYRVHRLVHFELLADMRTAIAREKQLKNWHRQWKINLINEVNPEWKDLAVSLGLPQLELGKPKNGS